MVLFEILGRCFWFDMVSRRRWEGSTDRYARAQPAEYSARYRPHDGVVVACRPVVEESVGHLRRRQSRLRRMNASTCSDRPCGCAGITLVLTKAQPALGIKGLLTDIGSPFWTWMIGLSRAIVHRKCDGVACGNDLWRCRGNARPGHGVRLSGGQGCGRTQWRDDGLKRIACRSASVYSGSARMGTNAVGQGTHAAITGRKII